MFEESKHPRDKGGKFTESNGGDNEEYKQSVNERIKWAKENGVDLPLNTDGSVDDLKLQDLISEKKEKTSTKNIVKVDLDADIQKQFDKATPQERTKIAFNYIMNNLRGKYPAEDGRIVAIERVGADKMSHTLNETKIRVLPELANLIEAGKLEGVIEAKKDGGQPHKLFTHFAYYKVSFQIGNDRYNGLLNVGIRKDGSSTLYDLNPFDKQ